MAALPNLTRRPSQILNVSSNDFDDFICTSASAGDAASDRRLSDMGCRVRTHRTSVVSMFEDGVTEIRSLGSNTTLPDISGMIKNKVKAQTNLKDKSPMTVGIICLSVFLATSCGVAAFVLHLAVRYAGCLSGINGCHEQILLDLLTPLGIGKSLYFVVLSGLSGLLCSLIIYSPFKRKIGRTCFGGGAVGAKIVISSGQHVSGWVPLLRIVLVTIYLGGGNTLGTEGPLIHMAASLATWQINLLGIHSRKLLSMCAVLGASAGLAAGFNVMITGVIFTIEELTRSLSQKSALIIILAAGVATLVKERLQEFLDLFSHIGHSSLAPTPDSLGNLSDLDVQVCLLLCLPIGILSGVFGWVFVRVAWSVQSFLDPAIQDKVPPWWQEMFLPRKSHLAIVGLLSACLGVIVYEVTGVNGVWGTSVGVIPESIASNLSFDKVILLFLGKFCAMTIATAAGGPGGSFVPSLMAGGLLGIAVARIFSCTEAAVAGCAVIGMGSLFASIMHMPATGVIMMFELTLERRLIVHVILASFIASNVVHRLPGGLESFVHITLHHNKTWRKLGGQDFIETDEQETHALNNVGMGQLHGTSVMKLWFRREDELLKLAFNTWHKESDSTGTMNRMELSLLRAQHRKHVESIQQAHREMMLRVVWAVLVQNYISALKTIAPTSPKSRKRRSGAQASAAEKDSDALEVASFASRSGRSSLAAASPPHSTTLEDPGALPHLFSAQSPFDHCIVSIAPESSASPGNGSPSPSKQTESQSYTDGQQSTPRLAPILPSEVPKHA